jgi:MFS family permease
VRIRSDLRELLPRAFEPPLLFAIFLDLVGFGMTFPDVQLRAQHYGAPGWMIGLILASYYPVQMIASPRWGRLSDRIGRKPVLLICSTLSAGSMVIYALGGNLWAMLFSRMAAGLGAANVVTAQAYVADTIPEPGLAAALGRVSAAVSLGLVAGPVIGGALASHGGNLLLGLAAAAASGLGAVWIFFTVPNLPPGDRRTAAEAARPLSLLSQSSPLLRLFVVASIGWLALACLEGTFGRLLEHNLRFGPMEFGILLTLEAGVAFMQGILFPFFSKWLRPDALLRVSYLLQAVGLGFMPFAGSFSALAVFCTLFGIGLGLAGPTIHAAASAITPADRQGELFGMLQSSRAVGFLIGPIIGGVLFDWRPAVPYLSAAGVLMLAILLVRRSAARPSPAAAP